MIVTEGEEVIYLFSYKSPGSHAMVNGVSAFEIIHEKYDMPGKIYRVPYLQDENDGLEMAAIAYFVLKLHTENNYELSVKEQRIFEIFKSLDITGEEQLLYVLLNHVFEEDVDTAYLSRLFDDAKVMVRSARQINQELVCPSLPCTRVTSDHDVKIITLANSNNSVKEYWENVSLSISAVSQAR